MSASVNPRFSFPPPSVHLGGGTGPHLRVPQSGGYVFRPRNVEGVTFDGKRMRNKSVLRRTVDYNPSVMNYLEDRIWQRDHRDARGIQPDALYQTKMLPPHNLVHKPMNCVTTKFVRTSTNKIRCPIFCVCWTPEGRRLITGASSGEFTLWNGLTFNFETILQAHDTSVRAMIWSHSNAWMLTADHGGFVKYWQSNMNNVKMYQAHKDPVRGLSFCPTDAKFASCSDDGTVRIWDFLRCHEERILRGHGADVKCVDWHPQKALIASGSKDTQQPLKLWDPRMGNSLATIHAHKHTVMELKWNRNGNWLLTASRDHLLKLFDVRNMKEEMQSFKGHKKEATAVAWHPINEVLFASGGSDGAMMFWLVGSEKEVGAIEEAHETMVWSLSWHPLGHILVSGSNDHTTKFWTRNRPGDAMRDRYNLNTMPMGLSEDMLEFDLEPSAMPNLPGMGLDKGLVDTNKENKSEDASIPGLDFSTSLASAAASRYIQRRKVPYAKPIPKDFESAWSGGKQPLAITRTRVPNGESSNQQQASTDDHPDHHQQPPSQMGPPRPTGPGGHGPPTSDGKGPMDQPPQFHTPGQMGPPRPPGQWAARGPRPWGQQGPRGQPPQGLLGHGPWDQGPRGPGPGPQGPGGASVRGQQDGSFRHPGPRPMRPMQPGPQQMGNNGQQQQQQQPDMWTNHQQQQQPHHQPQQPPLHHQQQQQQPQQQQQNFSTNDVDHRQGRNVDSQLPPDGGSNEYNDVDERMVATPSGGPPQYDSHFQDGSSMGRGGFGYQEYPRGRGRGYGGPEGANRGRPARGAMSAPVGQFAGQQHPPSLLDMPVKPAAGKRGWEEGPGEGEQSFPAPDDQMGSQKYRMTPPENFHGGRGGAGGMERGGMMRGGMHRGGGMMERGSPRGRGPRGAPWGGPRGGMGR